jgi:hypothetical protein
VLETLPLTTLAPSAAGQRLWRTCPVEVVEWGEGALPVLGRCSVSACGIFQRSVTSSVVSFEVSDLTFGLVQRPVTSPLD